MRYTVAEIHLENLAYNLRRICERVKPCKVMAVVKADAYGHGAVQVTNRLIEEGVQYFAVARIAEALELRHAGIDKAILIFGTLFDDQIENALAYDVRITVTDPRDIERISRIAARMGKIAIVHFNADTGMGRVGIQSDQAVEEVVRLYQNQNIRLEGIYSHFATSDTSNKAYAHLQLDRFRKLINDLRGHNIIIPFMHMANGGAILDIPEACQYPFNLVRAGIILYGQYPSLETSESIALKQVMALKTRVSLVRRLPEGTCISYGCRYTTSRETQIAVLPIGYADGIHRSFTNKAHVLIKGKLYPMVGTVTMDQIMVDVGDDEVAAGDMVLIWGDSPQGDIRASRLAEEVGTISYELCCSVSKRVPRIYIGK